MPKLSWGEISNIVHDIRDERVVISGAILRLKETDLKLKRIENNLADMITKHEDEDE